MGCKLTKFISGHTHTAGADELKESSDDNYSDIRIKDEDLVLAPILDERQKTLIRNTWKLLVDNVSKVGVITFMSLFETHPDVQNVFLPFRGMGPEELKYSKELRAHALRVMGFVQKIVARMEEPYKCQQLLWDLGQKHVNYGAKQHYIELVGPQFIYAIKPSLEEEWSEDIEMAWNQLFKYMGFHIKIGMSSVMTLSKKQTSAQVSGLTQKRNSTQASASGDDIIRE